MLMLMMKVYREVKATRVVLQAVDSQRESVQEDHNGVKDNQNHWRGVDSTEVKLFISDIYTVEQSAQYMFTKSHLTPYHLRQQKPEH